MNDSGYGDVDDINITIGWGGFDIKVIIKFIDGKVKEYIHTLDLEKTREEKKYNVTISPPEVFKIHITDMHSDWVNQGKDKIDLQEHNTLVNHDVS